MPDEIAAEIAVGEWWPLERVLTEFRPGSQGDDWTWQDEHDDLFNHPEKAPVTWALADRLSLEPQHDPITLGSDGRVWDGHHRIVVAMRLGIEKVLVDPPHFGAKAAAK